MSVRRSVAERIADSLKQSIVKGRLQPGDALPSERDLAQKYEVNRSSIREAVKRLQGWGLVQVRHGGATRVRDFLLSASVDMLPSLVEVGAVEPGILRDLHEIRGMLLGWCAERAAVLADGASLQRLELLVRAMEAAKAKPGTLQELDYDFFDALVQISGNRLLGLFSNVVRDVYMKSPGRFLSLYARGVFDPAHHRRTLDAIRARNARAAADAMRAHAATALEAP
jgi:GntR family transcriptional repressor for pyruvate dehydrogenase complex